MSQIIRDITNIARCGVQFRADALAPMGLKSCHISYLSEICQCPGISQDYLARRICINKSNIARQLAVLEEGDFVTRTPSTQDKRVTELYPTEKTLALLPRLLEIQQTWERRLTQDMSPEDAALLTRLLQGMMARASDYMEGR